MLGELGLRDGEAVRRHGRWIRPALRAYFRPRVEGLEHLPSGPFLGVGNHSGAAMIPDVWVWAAEYTAERNRPPLLVLAHEAFFTVYPERLARFLSRLGAVRADRKLARAALDAGYAVQVYPGGDHDACRSYALRNRIVFAGRRGYVELARDAGVPIVPVVSHGAHGALLVLWDGVPLARALGLEASHRLAVFPLTVSVPWGLWLGPLPGYLPLPVRIRIRVLPPIDPTADHPAAIDALVRSEMQSALDAMCSEEVSS